MIESFVDLTYRGLALGRRVKLTQVRPTSGYLETPAPMPVGTAIVIATDEGLVIDASVTGVHEQTGGSERPPGMIVAPDLADDARASWWRARVSEEPAPAAPADRSKPITVRPRSHTIQTPPPADAVLAAVAEVADVTQPVSVPDEPPGGKTIAMTAVAPPDDSDEASASARRTMAMPAVDQELLASLTKKSGDVEQLVRTTGEHAIVDDGQRTTVMSAVDPAALGLEVSSSGSMPAAQDDDSGDGNDDPRKTSPGMGAGGKKKKKRR